MIGAGGFCGGNMEKYPHPDPNDVELNFKLWQQELMTIYGVFTVDELAIAMREDPESKKILQEMEGGE